MGINITIAPYVNSTTEWSQEYYESVYNIEAYSRPTDWLELETLTEGDQKFVGLHSVYSHNSNFVAFTVSGAYTVDWGDGSATENISAGSTAYHNFQYESFIGQTECSRGYKQAIVTITPQSGQNLTSINLDVKHNATNLPSYKGQWLDISIVGQYVSSIDLGGFTSTIQQFNLEQFNFIGTNSITNFGYMFQNCYSLQSIPLLNTSKGTDFSGMFYYCNSLQTIPLIDTSNGITFINMFQNCYSLQTIPLLDTSKGTIFSNMFTGCVSLGKSDILNTKYSISYTTCKLSATELNNIFNNLATRYSGAAQTITISSNWGNTLISKSSITSTANSTTIPITDTSSLATGMEVYGTYITGTRTVTFNSTANITYTNHQLLEGTTVSFTSTVAGFTMNVIYYVVSVTTNTFQLSATSGGTAITATVSTTGAMRAYPKIVTINTNTSIVLDVPAAVSGSNTMTASALSRSVALHKGWTIVG